MTVHPTGHVCRSPHLHTRLGPAVCRVIQSLIPPVGNRICQGHVCGGRQAAQPVQRPSEMGRRRFPDLGLGAINPRAGLEGSQNGIYGV